MAATGNEVVLLKQLEQYDYNKIRPQINSKIDRPTDIGTDGQMLVYGESGNQWIDVPEGTAYSADNATLQLSGTQFSVKDSGITAAKIADGTITADKLASGVIPDVSGFITTTTADGKYAAKSHTHSAATTSAAGFMSAADKAKLDALPSSFTDPAVDIVRTTTHSTSYTKDTLEIVTDSTGKVTEMWFVTAD